MASSKPQRTECPVPAEHRGEEDFLWRKSSSPMHNPQPHNRKSSNCLFGGDERWQAAEKMLAMRFRKYAAAPQSGRSWSRRSIREALLQQTGNRAARMFLSFRPTPHHNPNQNETLCYTLTTRMRESRSQKSSAFCDHSDGGQQDRNWTPEDCESASTFSGNSLLHGHGPNGAKE